MNPTKSIFTVPGSFKSTATPQDTSDRPGSPFQRRSNSGSDHRSPSNDKEAESDALRNVSITHEPSAVPARPAPRPRSSTYDSASLADSHATPSQPAPATSTSTSKHSHVFVERQASPLPQAPTNNSQTPPSGGRKRVADGPPPSDSSAQPGSKKARLHRPGRHILDSFTFKGPSINTVQPPSPLFFSNSPRVRPQLPARFSSAEAAIRMLSKARTEEGHVKTVSLARGTVLTPSVTSAPMRALSDRSSSAKSVSPDVPASSDPAIAMLGSIGITELLEQDERPTIVVDLADISNYGSGPLHAMFANTALRSFPSMLEIVTGVSNDHSPGPGVAMSHVQFKSWLLSAAVNGESLDVCLPSFIYAGMTWSCSTLRKRLRIVSGAYISDGSHAPRIAAGTIAALTPEARGITPVVPISAPRSIAGVLEEPTDYFGNAAPPPPAMVSRAVSHDVVPTTETSGQLTLTPRKSDSKLAHRPLASPNFHEGNISGGSLPSLTNDSVLGPPSASGTDWLDSIPTVGGEGPSFDWTRIPVSETMPRHIQFARSIDWSSTALGPIELWPPDLRQMCNLIMASPHPAAMYWGDDLIAIYNEAYILLAGQKHPMLMGKPYKIAWAEIWDEVKEVFVSARLTGEATMKDDDCLFIKRNDYLEETYFSWSIIPMVGSDGSVTGLYNPAFEKTRRKIAERRMLTLREIGERTASARDLKGFWEEVLGALELNEYDTPFVLLYSVSDDADSDTSSMHSSSVFGTRQCLLEGTLGVPEGHNSAPQYIDLKAGMEGFGPVFREVMKTDKPILLEVGTKDLPASLTKGIQSRGFGEPCRAVVVCPIHPTTGETVLGFLVLGVNSRRPYDEDYSLFVQLLSRQLGTSLASVVLFEEEIRRGQRAAKLAAMDRIELSEQLAARTQEAIESETKFTRMAEFAPVGMFIASAEGKVTYCNDTWFDVSQVPRSMDPDRWMDAIKDEDHQLVANVWRDLLENKKPVTCTFRFQASWKDLDGTIGERWVLFSAYPEKYGSGNLKSVFGSLTDISKQKWAERFQKNKMEEAVELKRQQENFIDMTSHEMRNPLSAILQCADEVSTTMARFRDEYMPKNGGSQVAKDSTGPRSKETVDESITSVMEAAQTIALCAQHQKRIVDDILTLSKLDSALLQVTPIDSQPLSVVQRALKMHEGELQSNDIQLRFRVDDSFKELAIDWVRFDPSRVLQVLINLTTNAIKFTTTERRRTITVILAASKRRPTPDDKHVVDYFPSKRPDKAEAFRGGDWGEGEEVYIHFAVQDTGRGLSDEEKKVLFLRFSQASPRTHIQYGGSGLGLFISRELTELQGGQIGVASEAGKGSTFAFYVRARRTDPPATAENATTIQKQAGDVGGSKLPATDNGTGPEKTNRPIKVLIVEDNLVNQRVLQKQLKNLGCIVHVANHGGEALDRLRSSTYWKHPADAKGERIELNVVLMDQEMPVMDGLTCTKKIRELEKEGNFVTHIPVIAVTANARSEQIQTALEAGMDDVVSKPFRVIPDLIPKIEELMARFPEPSLV